MLIDEDTMDNKTPFTIEPHGPHGHYALYSGRSPVSHGYNLCSLSDFDANGENTRENILTAMNDHAKLLRRIEELTEEVSKLKKN